MKEAIRYGLILGLICFVASGLLACVNQLTKTRIIAQAQTAEDASLKEVLPEGIYFEAVKSDGENIYYKAYDKDKQFVGVAFKVIGKGYSGTIETMVGMSKNGTINAIKILSQNETPGLGARITEPPFTNQFVNRDNKGLAGIQAIAGATISSKAVIDSVKKKTEEIKTLIKDE